jgi:deazaflavin-dependent oxidoreductase (nitroreductase family)
MHAPGPDTVRAMSTAMDRATQAFNLIHRNAFTASNGRLLGRISGMPVVKLTTTGRKSGRQRTTMLTSPVKDGDNLVLVASYGGSPKHPDWFLNLRDKPEVEVMTRDFKGRRRARVATSEERARLWPQIAGKHKNYAGYQTKTTREIPLVILEPAD